MKKLLISLALIFTLISQAYCYDIIVTIDDKDITRVKTALLKIVPNTIVQLKAGAKPSISGEYQANDYELKYTAAEWLNIIIKDNFILNTVARVEQQEKMNTAAQQASTDPKPTIAITVDKTKIPPTLNPDTLEAK